jgi:hypothetical protein
MASFPLAVGSQEATDQFAISKVKNYQQNAGQVQLEGFKVETILQMMNNCADACKLSYRMDGIKSQDVEEVRCFTSCVTKSYGLAMSSLN